ncbi:MAG: cupin domain-containing protein [Spirochaetes bacterium]|nr:cupin domain-containing protein [Spirochaetota bacterium]
MGKLYFADEAARLDTIDPGKVTRKVKAHGEKTMMVEVYFEQGAEGSLHRHEHEQLSYCLEGVFDFLIGEATYSVKPGDSVLIPSGQIHGVLCLSTGRLLDIFSPPRKEFLA